MNITNSNKLQYQTAIKQKTFCSATSFKGITIDNFEKEHTQNNNTSSATKLLNQAKNALFKILHIETKEEALERKAQEIKKEALDFFNEEDAEFAYNAVKTNIEDKYKIFKIIRTCSKERREQYLKLYQLGFRKIDLSSCPDLNDEMIEIAGEIKKMGFKDDAEILYCTTEYQYDKEHLDILKKLKEEGFKELETLAFANEMDEEKLKNAIKLKQITKQDFLSLSTAKEGIDEKHINQISAFKKAGIEINDFVIKKIKDDLTDEQVSEIIQLNNNLTPQYPISTVFAVYEAGAKNKVPSFIRLDKYFNYRNAEKLINADTTEREVGRLVKNKIALILDGNYSHTLEEVKNYPTEDIEESQMELIDEIIYFVETFNITVYNAASAISPYLLASEPLIRKKDIQESLLSCLKEKLKPEEKEKLLKVLERVEASINQTITAQKINPEQRKEFWSGFLANNGRTDEVIKSADFKKFKTDGLGLIYPRKNFISDLNKVLDSLDNKTRLDILRKLEITLTSDKLGYDGIVNLEKLDKNNKTEFEIYEIANKFLNENMVTTGDKELDFALNSLIKGMPEFINVIGKKQHANHAYSVDIHILKVYQNCLLDSDFEKLSNLDKTCLKVATIFHDIAKIENNIDKSHPEISARYSQDILEQYNFPSVVGTRILELIRNHHWFEEYNYNSNNKDCIQKIAPMFRCKDDYTISKIMTRADIEAIGNDIFLKFIDDLNKPEKLTPLKNQLSKINSSGQILITSKIIHQDKIPIISHKGKKYKVIDFNTLKENENLEKFGFEKGTTKENLRLLVHMTKPEATETLFNLEKVSNQGLLSTSYISTENKTTYCDQKFGVSLESQNSNIANASSTNQASGTLKDFDGFAGFTNNDFHRNEIPDKIKEILGLSDDEYRELYETLASKKYFSQITKEKSYKIGNKEIKSQDIVNAIRIAGDEIIKGEQNEVLLYTPKINAFVAKVDSINKIPQEYLDVIRRHNLTIYLLGEDN